jgi:hypothetical protein
LADLGIEQQLGIRFDKRLPHAYCPLDTHLLVAELLGKQQDRSAPLARIPLPVGKAPDEELRDTQQAVMRLPHRELMIRLPERNAAKWSFPRRP